MCDNTTRRGLGQPTWAEGAAITCITLGPAWASIFFAVSQRNAAEQDWNAYSSSTFGLVLGVTLTSVGVLLCLFSICNRIGSLLRTLQEPEGREEK